MSSDGGALLLELFLDSHAAAPEEIVLDVDAPDDPLHGRQEGRFFHGYYDCYCYLPLYVTCGPHLLCGRQRASTTCSAWPRTRGSSGARAAGGWPAGGRRGGTAISAIGHWRAGAASGGSGCRCPRCFRARSCSRTAWRGCGRRRRDSLWASGRDSRGATRGGQREVCSPCANSPSRTGRVPRNRSRLTQIWLREGIPEHQGREISCRPASNSPLPGPVTPKSEAA